MSFLYTKHVALAAIVIDDDENDGQQAGHQEATAVHQDAVTSNDCVICYEEYDEDGDHKPVVLKCGHHAGEPLHTFAYRGLSFDGWKPCEISQQVVTQEHCLGLGSPPPHAPPPGEPCMERWLESKKSCPTCRKP